MRARFVAISRALILIAIVWVASSGGEQFVLAQTTPSATIKVWNITPTIGFNPDESVEDIAGITGHVATTANPQTIATTIENTTHPEGPCGLIFWNPATNSFKWYGVTGGFSAGIDLNVSAPVLTGLAGSVFGAPTFQPGDVWVSVNSNSSTPLYVNFKGSNNFRHFPVSSGGVNGVQVDQTTGNIYFTDPSAGRIGRLNPSTNGVTSWVVGGTPHYAAIDNAGRVYSAVAGASVAGGVDAIVRIDPAATINNVTSWAIPGGGLTPGLSFQTPDGVAFDTAGNLWFTESTSNEIGRLNPSTGEICEFTKTGLSNPQLIASSGIGSLLQSFFTEGTGNAVSVVTQAAAVPITSPCPTRTPSVSTVTSSGFTVSSFDSIRTPRTATITPLPVSVSGVDGTPGIIRFPMPTPTGGSASAPNFPSGMTGVVVPTTVFGSYLDPSFAGNSAVFQVSSSAIVAPPPVLTFLSFPLRNKTAFSVKINTIFDHSMRFQYCADETVTAYTGEQGSSQFPSSFVTSFTCQITHRKNPLHGFEQQSGAPFSVNGQYVGGSTLADTFFLFYQGHPGYDYRTTDQNVDGTLCPTGNLCNPNGKTEVLAAADGTVLCVNPNAQPTSSCSEGPGEVKIDHHNGYLTIYLHLSHIFVNVSDSVSGHQTIIGTSGDIGSPGAPHLHFEVRKMVPQAAPVPVDPYGWRGNASIPNDPYTRAMNVNLWK